MALTKAAAKAITADLDRLAQLFEADHSALGVPANVATDFAYRCDLLSDFVEKRGGLDRAESVQKSDVADEVSVSHQPDEPYMADKTTQDELYELGQMVEGGGLGKAALQEIATKVAELLKAAGDDEDAEASDDEDAEASDDEGDDEGDKKAHLINLANNLLRLAGDDDDEDEDEDEDDDEAEGDDDGDDGDDDDEGKTAFAHGYSV